MNAATFANAKAAELRRAFDDARAHPWPDATGAEFTDLIAVRIAGDPYALRIGELTSLLAAKRVVPFPTPIPALLGVAGIRGAAVPVYSLARLLGYAAASERTRWLALCSFGGAFAAAFGEFEGHLRVNGEDLYGAETRDAARTFVTHIVHTEASSRAVVSMPLLSQSIEERCRHASLAKEP